MTYFFIREYNQAYDVFITRYFRAHGIAIDEGMTFEEANDKFPREFRQQGTSEHSLFLKYMTDWGLHPSVRPALYRYLDPSLGGKGSPDLKKMRELESELEKGHGKLLFLQEEVAVDISNFYRRYFEFPLRDELSRQLPPRALSKYLNPKEMGRITDASDDGSQRVEEVVRKIGEEALAWLSKITPDKILADLERVLDEHFASDAHMRRIPGDSSGEAAKMQTCDHETEYVSVNSYHDIDGGVSDTQLRPARGYGVADEVFGVPEELIVKEWDEAVYPVYHVTRTGK